MIAKASVYWFFRLTFENGDAALQNRTYARGAWPFYLAAHESGWLKDSVHGGELLHWQMNWIERDKDYSVMTDHKARISFCVIGFLIRTLL